MRSEHIQYRVNQQGATHDLIKSAFSNLIKVGRNNLTSTRIQIRLDALQDQWHQFDVNHRAIQLAKFNGTLSEWLSFKGLYISLVYSNPFINDVAKLQYLKTSLVGSAAFLLKGTDVIAENLQPTWSAVLAFYENERRLVNATLKMLFSLKKMTKDSAKELEHLYMSFNEVYRTLESLNRPVQHYDDFLVFMMTQRLDPESIKAWEIHLGASKSTPSWQQLKEFLESRLLSLQSFESSQTSLSQRAHPASTARMHHTTSLPSCPVCTKSHYLFQCDSFLAKTLPQRRDYVLSKGLCFNCLGNHKVNKCQSTRRCRNCGKKHHSKLHFSEKNSTPVPLKEPTNKQSNHVCSENQQTTTVLLATARVIVKNLHGEQRTIWALLDQGSEISIISERIVQLLELPRKKSFISIIGVGGNQAGKTRGLVDLIINLHFDSSTTINIQACILPKLTSTLPSPNCPTLTSWEHLRNLQLADPEYQSPKQIDLIIGADYHGHLLEGSIKKGAVDGPVAQLTTLGWIISGPVSFTQTKRTVTYHSSLDHDLYKLLERFWTQEELPCHKSTSLSREDQLCEDHFRSTHDRDSTGRYVLRLPFKKSTRQLGNSIPSSQRALRHLTLKFDKDPEFFKMYSAFMNEYKEMNHMVQVPNQHDDASDKFYLPHHGVIKESSTTTKLRVVFNGSCQTTDGVPINDLLHTGAKLQADLIDVLLWFRQFQFVFSADIEKMYRQIKIHPADWRFQQILWREFNRILKHQLTTVTYGLACAPFQALRTILQLIQDEGHKYPQAVDILKYGRYVDDMAGGFPLKKWVSNHPSVLAKTPDEDRASTASIQLQDDTVRALGLFWNPATDQLRFKFSFHTPKTISKRSVLSKIAQLFDPLGLLSPVFIKLKIFMQELWAVKLTWDEQLPNAQLDKWTHLQMVLQGLESIAIPRWIGLSPSRHIEIHGFCDASQAAMAATVFIRTSSSTSISSHLLCSKTKVAPLKRMTIPRLELSAAVMLSKLVKHCQQVLQLNTSPCHLWTDSTIVHTWISNHPSKWKDFVHNRVCAIQESLPSAQWHHIVGTSNPADCATRGLSTEELKSHALWWNGPEWLIKDCIHWPKSTSKTTNDQNLEIKTTSTLHIKTAQPWNLMEKYSSWKRLTRIIALCQRMVALLLKRPAPSLKTPITPEELNNAVRFIIKHHQRPHFRKETEALQQEKEIPRRSPLVRLCPRLDKFGILRVGGRLDNLSLAEDAKHPYILPRHAHISKLLIEDAHRKTLHGSTRDTLAYIRQKYWIIGGRAPVKSIILKCVTCTRHRRQQAQYLMGQLPPSGVTPARPFLHSGVDYAGPFMMKTWQGRARLYKAWIAVFVCFVTSAVHLEIVSDYSTNAFIAAYRRFTSRRGICATITSDCGTTFQGADKELKRMFSQCSSELQQIASLIASDGTKWIFNPPSAPHFGGKFEAAVKSMKYHLKRLIGETKLTYEQMATIITQIEAILNSRPLCAMTNDPEDLSILTPAHFLVGHALILTPEPTMEYLKMSRLSHWQQLTRIIQRFWTIWSKELLQRHLSMYKRNRQAKPIAIGDLVLVSDERYPPAKWPLGRVIEVHPGSDNIVRVVTLKTSTSTLLRPVVKLVPLPVSSSEQEFVAEIKEGER